MNHLSLFSGIGGLDLAAQWAGFKTSTFVECDPFCTAVIRRRFPDAIVYPDIRKFCRRLYDCEPIDEEGEALCPRCGIDFGECACIGTDQFTDTHGHPLVISGGFPCQPHSRLGKRGGQSDERDLWPEFARVISELDPAFVVAENVEGAIDTVLDRCIADLEGMHYEVEALVYPASLFGAEHRRERLFIVAHTQSERVEGMRAERKRIAHSLAPTLLPLRDSHGLWKIEPDIRRVPYGFSRRMDRLRALGNAVVPHQAFPLFDAIARFTLNEEHDHASAKNHAR